MKYDVVIIGGGASGLMCALNIQNKKILIIDKNFALGKKLLVTGNGRCNLTNVKTLGFNTNIDKYLKQFDNAKTIEFFNGLGLKTYADDEGRVYPSTNSAKSVVDVLNYWIKKKNIDIKLDAIVKSVDFDKKVVNCGETIEYDKLVIATSNEVFGLEKVAKTPSLCALKTKEDTRGLENAKVDCLVTAKCGKETMSERGEVLFKDGGLSGIVIFNMSALFARNKKFDGSVTLDLLPDEHDISYLKLRRDKFDIVKYLLLGLIVDSLRSEIFKRLKIDEQMPCKNLTDGQLKQIDKMIHNFDFHVVGHYDNNQVFSGGVSLASLTENLSHKTYDDVYVIGEACDVDGICGGYNLQWAWTSGYIAGKDISKK